MPAYEYKSNKDRIFVEDHSESSGDIMVTVSEPEDHPFQPQVARILISLKEVPNLIAALQKIVGPPAPPKDFGELYKAATAILPSASVEQDASGQLVIHTNLREVTKLVPFED